MLGIAWHFRPHPRKVLLGGGTLGEGGLLGGWIGSLKAPSPNFDAPAYPPLISAPITKGIYKLSLSARMLLLMFSRFPYATPA